MLSAAILLARVIGLAQVSAISWLMSQADSDAYTAAFRITDFVNYLVAGGALSATFIPLFVEFKETGNRDDAWRFFSSIASIMSLVLLVILGTAWIFMTPIAARVTQYSGEKLAMTVAMTRIMLPAQACFYLGGLAVGILNAHRRFGASSLTGAVYNVVALLTGLALWFALGRSALSFAWGIFFGAFCGNFLLPVLAALRGPREDRLRFWFLPSLHVAGVTRFFRNALPIMIGVSFPVVDQIVMPYFTGHLSDGTLTQLDRGNRVMVAALAMIAQAASVAAFPYLASDSAAGKWDSFAEFLRNGLRRLMFLSLPLATLLILLAQPIIWILFRHGHFTPQAAQNSAVAFSFYCVGMFAWTGQQLVARALYALQDTITPTVIGSALTIFFFIPLCYFAAHSRNPILALALATSVGACAQFCGVFIALEKKLARREYGVSLRCERVLGTLLRTLAACFVMSVAGLLVKLGCDSLLSHALWAQLARVIVISPCALLAFAFAAQKFQIPEWTWLKGKISRRRA